MIKKRISNWMQNLADAQFDRVVDDCAQSLMALAISSAVKNGLVDDGELTKLGAILMDAFFDSYSSNTVAAPTKYPELELWKNDAATNVPELVADFFAGNDGTERLNCVFVFLLADVYAPELKHLKLYSVVRSILASHIVEDMQDHWLMHRVKFDGRGAYINYANHFVNHLTLYGYSLFRVSLPIFAQSTVPDIRTFIRLRGLKR
jgi:hypothetical protein